MKGRKNGGFVLITILIFALFLLQSVALFFYNKTVFFVNIGVFVLLCSAAVLCYVRVRTLVSKSITDAALLMTDERTTAINDFTAPTVVLSRSNAVMWYNKAFSSSSDAAKNMLGVNFRELIGEAAFDKLITAKSADVGLFNRIYKLLLLSDGDNKVIYFIDQTSLKKTAAEYRFSRPVAALFEIDSLDQILNDVKDSRKAQICGEIQDLIEKWFSTTGGIMRTISNERFFLLFEERHLQRFEDEKFKILEIVRNYEVSGNKSLTLSIGIGHGCKTLAECEQLARKALDMSLSRGGDQAAVKSPTEDYKFYGGASTVAEKGSRVRARTTANSLCELINAAENVIVMGHRYSDLDSLGAAFALSQIAELSGRPVHIVLEKEETMAASLLSYIENAGYKELIISGKKAAEFTDEGTLLIVVDTHRPSFTDSPELLSAAGTVAVIDHHRKATDYIDSAVIFYNETVASSVCQMVAELWQYISHDPIGKVAANALLAGIMLDTKNFVLNVGVRTFEAAAFLRKNGADTVLVKKMFSDTMEIYKKKYAVISSAQLYNGCVVAINPEECADTRMVAAQAADELMSVNQVKASFVMYPEKGSINISARSYGEINVQLVMEALGGGGHRTMAACSIKDSNFEEALTSLQAAIDNLQ